MLFTLAAGSQGNCKPCKNVRWCPRPVLVEGVKGVKVVFYSRASKRVVGAPPSSAQSFSSISRATSRFVRYFLLYPIVIIRAGIKDLRFELSFTHSPHCSRFTTRFCTGGLNRTYSNYVSAELLLAQTVHYLCTGYTRRHCHQ